METSRKAKAEMEAAAAQKGVSFSIKMKPKDPESVTQLKKPLFDYGSSDEEHEGKKKLRNRFLSVKFILKLKHIIAHFKNGPSVHLIHNMKWSDCV